MLIAFSKHHKKRKLRRLVSRAYAHGQDVILCPEWTREHEPLPNAHRALKHAFGRGKQHELVLRAS